MIYDKRKLKRYNIFLIVEFKPLKSPGRYSIGITRDMSPDGFSLESQTIDCQSGDIMEFRLKHPDTEWSVTISGEVIWKNHSWYKFAIGIKFLNADEEQNAKIYKLMSAVRDKADKPELISNDSGGAETEIVHAAISEAGATDNSLPHTCMTNATHIALKEAEHCSLTGKEKTFIARDEFDTSSDEAVEKIKPAGDIENIEEADKEDEKIYTANVDSGFGRKTAQTTFNNIDFAGNNQRKRGWLYVPFAAIVVIIFVIALPVMIKKFNNTLINSRPEVTESADYRHVEKDGAVSATNNSEMSGQSLNESSGPSQFQQTGEKPEVSVDNILRPESAANSEVPRNNAEKNTKIDVIADIDETLKALHAMQNERPSEARSIAETQKTKEAVFVKSEKAPETEATNNAIITNPDLLKKWEPIGSTQSGVPLFISPDNISHPYEDVVNLLVKASVNKKEFIDLLAINCSQIKLRILEERNGNNPVLSTYSNEWRDIIPDSMILYNSACPEKK